jgi:hypothetical protein
VPRFGGSGANAHEEDGADGGGAFGILARGEIDVSGTIDAQGSDAVIEGGGGGGGGGIVILASTATVSVSGTVDCSGGDGADTDDSRSGTGVEEGGGGGGGIVHLLAPSISATGTLDVAGGLAGTCSRSNCVIERVSGSGGGASGGGGGHGSDRNGTSTIVRPAQAGEDGYSFETLGDPTPLL